MLKKLIKYCFLTLILFNSNSFCMEEGYGDQELKPMNSDSILATGYLINDHQVTQEELVSIKGLNNSLNQSPVFNTTNLKDRVWLESERAALGGEEVIIETQDGCLVPCWYFNRGKSKAILIAPGFGGGFEEMLSLVEIYSDYDVLLLDYWGHGFHNATDKSKTAWYRNPADRLFSERFRREHLDVKAALEFLNDPVLNGTLEKEQRCENRGYYKEIIGAGNCYSTLVLSKVQAESEENYKPAFNKLIFDSSWLSTYDVGKKVAHDPYLSFDQIHGGAPWILKMFMNIPYLDNALLKLGELVLGIDLKEHSILKYISKVNCPILFIQGDADKLVSQEEFETIIDACEAPKLVLRTPDKHSVIRYKSKEIYKFVVDSFIEALEFINLSDRDIRDAIEHQLNYNEKPAPLNHTNLPDVVETKKFFDVKTTCISLITLAAACYVSYTLYNSPSKDIVDTVATLKID